MVAYLLGSIPTGYTAAQLIKGIDIREHGSGPGRLMYLELGKVCWFYSLICWGDIGDRSGLLDVHLC